MKRNYEGLFIIDPNLTQDETEALLAQIAETITKNGGEITETQRWGKRRLAYEIKKQTDGFYYLAYFAGDPAGVVDMKRVFKLADGILRDLIFIREQDVIDALEKAKALEAQAKVVSAPVAIVDEQTEIVEAKPETVDEQTEVIDKKTEVVDEQSKEEGASHG